MSIRDMRAGDTIIPASGMVAYEAEDVDRFAGRVKARRIDGKGRPKTFRAERLFCVDFDDGLWQETEAPR